MVDKKEPEAKVEAASPKGAVAKYRLGHPYWDNRILHERGEILEFPIGGQPSTSKLVE